MAGMTGKLAASVLACGLVFGALAMACGGGGDGKSSSGPRVTDPAKVPSSTPLVNPILFTIRLDGQISTSGGPTITVSPNSTSTAAKKYTVAAGDTCSAIAQKNGVTVEELLKANRTIDAGCTNIHAGDILTIPGPATPVPTANTGVIGGPTTRPSGKTYTVASGDTCSGIAQSYGVKVADLISANGLDADCKSLKPGQVLKIP